MSKTEALSLISRITKKPLDVLHLESSLETVGWDSLCSMELVALADDFESLDLDLDSVYSAKTVSDLVNALM